MLMPDAVQITITLGVDRGNAAACMAGVVLHRIIAMPRVIALLVHWSLNQVPFDQMEASKLSVRVVMRRGKLF
jgi:hypothetical protein